MKNPIVDSEILHGGEDRDVKRRLESRNKFFMFVIACLLIYLFTLLTLVLLLHLHILFITLHSSFSFVGVYSSQQEDN